jgi:hypothetical protein
MTHHSNLPTHERILTGVSCEGLWHFLAAFDFWGFLNGRMDHIRRYRVHYTALFVLWVCLYVVS